MTTAKITTPNSTELAPSYKIPLAIILLSLPLVIWQPIVSLVIGVFGLFLTFQTVFIRLKFTETALEVYRSSTMIRVFPYEDWQTWRIFWQPIPILFYFREVKSIHFLPIIFDPKALKSCLENIPNLPKE